MLRNGVRPLLTASIIPAKIGNFGRDLRKCIPHWPRILHPQMFLNLKKWIRKSIQKRDHFSGMVDVMPEFIYVLRREGDKGAHWRQARDDLEGRWRLHYPYLYVPSRKRWIYGRSSRTQPRTLTRARSVLTPMRYQLPISALMGSCPARPPVNPSLSGGNV